MKELGMTNNSEGVIETFQDIVEISRNCKFTDCKHINESGCAVIDALRSGIINQALYDNYQRINKEQERFQTSAAEKRRKDRAFGKMIRDYYKNKKSEF
jgi:ribosome biogenesis GTPase